MRIQARINKNVKLLVGVSIVTVIGLGGLLILLAGDSERSRVPTVSSQTQASTEMTQTSTQIATEPGVTIQAQELYNARVDKIDDVTAVARLLEVIDLRGNLGSYKPVELQTKKSPKSMKITFTKKVQIPEAERSTFDNRMEKYAQQILALVADADQVQWSYIIKKTDGSMKVIKVSFDAKQKTALVKNNIKTYGQSAKKINELLKLQEEPGKDIAI